MKDWIKKQFEMTPNKRILIAFILGTVQAGIVYAFLMDWHGQAYYIEMVTNRWHEMHWAWWFIPWAVILWAYVRNGIRFENETLWMTIKNPAKVTVDQDEADKYSAFGVNSHSGAKKPTRPMRPPPPPAPPAKRTLPPKGH